MSKPNTNNGGTNDLSDDKSLELLCSHLKGQVVTVRTKTAPRVLHTGIVTKSEFSSVKGLSIVLIMHHEKGDILAIPNEIPWEISYQELLEISVAPLVVAQKKEAPQHPVGPGFKTDEEISGAAFRERELQKWSADAELLELPSSDLLADVEDDPLEDDDLDDDDDGSRKGKKKFKKKGKGKGKGKEKEWDQFEANYELNKYESNFEQEYESSYTTVLDRTSAFYKDRIANASKIAADIEKASARNPHQREERGQTIEDEEEELYSSVKRDDPPPGFSSTPPTNISGSRGREDRTHFETSGGLRSSGSLDSGTNSPSTSSPSMPNPKYIIPSRRKDLPIQEKTLKISNEGSRSPKTEQKSLASVSALGLEPPKVSDKVVTEYLNFTEESKKKGKQEEIEQLRRFSEGYDRKKSGSPRTSRSKAASAVSSLAGSESNSNPNSPVSSTFITGPSSSSPSSTPPTSPTSTSVSSGTTTPLSSSTSTSSLAPTPALPTSPPTPTSPANTNANPAVSPSTLSSSPSSTATAVGGTATATVTAVPGAPKALPALTAPKNAGGLNPFAKEFKPGSFSFTPKPATQPPQQPHQPQTVGVPQPVSMMSQPPNTSPQIPLPYTQYLPYPPQGPMSHVAQRVPIAVSGMGLPPGHVQGPPRSATGVPFGATGGPHLTPGTVTPMVGPIVATVPNAVGMPSSSTVTTTAALGGPTPMGTAPRTESITEMYNRVQKLNDAQPPKRKALTKWGSSSSSSSSTGASPSGGISGSSGSSTPPASPTLSNAPGTSPPASWQVYIPRPTPMIPMMTSHHHHHHHHHQHTGPVIGMVPPGAYGPQGSQPTYVTAYMAPSPTANSNLPSNTPTTSAPIPTTPRRGGSISGGAPSPNSATFSSSPGTSPSFPSPMLYSSAAGAQPLPSGSSYGMVSTSPGAAPFAMAGRPVSNSGVPGATQQNTSPGNQTTNQRNNNSGRNEGGGRKKN